jgi:hypothetical protein
MHTSESRPMIIMMGPPLRQRSHNDISVVVATGAGVPLMAVSSNNIML